MTLNDLIRDGECTAMTGDGMTAITGVEYDSRKVKPGAVFVAVQGCVSDGNTFIQDALKRGAAAIITDEPGVTAPVPVALVPDARKALAVIAGRFFGSPQESLVMTAVTGTNGKTTTAFMVRSIFRENGIGCGLIGTIEHLVGGERVASVNTTPESRDLHQFLARMVAAGEHACVMEVSSHALALGRVHGIRYRAVAFTNITRDHLDFHGDFESYLNAKSILFSGLSGDSTAVVNADDPHAAFIVNSSRGGSLLTYGFGEKCDLRAQTCELLPDGSRVRLVTPWGAADLFVPVPGAFNVSNALAAAGIGLACGISLDGVVQGIGNMEQVRGRFQRIDEGQPFGVIIDYAHTPDALERILTSVRAFTRGRVIVAFGCGGDRDAGKRPQMGAIAGKLADSTVITSDNPRTEDPQAIIDAIEQGMPPAARYMTVVDREDGIRQALKQAGPGDTVVIAGKGHEDYQIIGKEKFHFDDAESVRRSLKAMSWN